ncbi:498_t:CDS:2, partial [Gigaspora margarita]
PRGKITRCDLLFDPFPIYDHELWSHNPQISPGFHTHHKSTSYPQRPQGGLAASITMKAVLDDDDDTQKNLEKRISER